MAHLKTRIILDVSVRDGMCTQRGNGSTAQRSACEYAQPRRYSSRRYAHFIAHGHQRRRVRVAKPQLDSSLVCCRSYSALAPRPTPTSVSHCTYRCATLHNNGALEMAVAMVL